MKPQIFINDEKQQTKEKIESFAIGNNKLVGKNILITGACNGIGKILSLVAAKSGAQVILLDKSIPELESIYNEIMQLDGAESETNATANEILEPFLLPMNLAGSTLDDYLDMAKTLGENIGHLDGIIHNAAQFSGLYSLLQIPPKDLVEQIQVNLTAPIWLNQALFSLLKKSTSPTLLFADHCEACAPDAAYWNGYAIAKIGLMKAMQLLALEHGENYNLFTYGYNTGWVNTVLARNAFPNAGKGWKNNDDVDLAMNILNLFNRQHQNGSIVDLR